MNKSLGEDSTHRGGNTHSSTDETAPNPSAASETRTPGTIGTLPQKRTAKLKAWIPDLWGQGADRQLELILAGAIAIFAFCQLIVTILNNYGTSAQVNKIISATNGIKGAATSFSESAANINLGMTNAVKTMQQQVDQIKRSANAAEGAVHATRDQMRLDQRAWVGITEIDIKDPIAVGKPFVWVGYIENSGKTPALAIRMLFRYRTALGTNYPRFTYGATTHRRSAIIVLQPSSKISIGGHATSSDPNLTAAQINALRTGLTRMYIFGEISYEDIFGVRHTTRVCAWVDPDLQNTHPCAAYNDAD